MGISDEKSTSRRFEREEGGHVAFADCRIDGGKLLILHVEAPVLLRGTGAAGRLMEDVVRAAEAEGLPLVPICGYARVWLARRKD